MDAGARRRTTAIVAAVVLVVGVAAGLLRLADDGPAPAVDAEEPAVPAAPMATGARAKEPERRDVCAGSARPFAPDRITIDGVLDAEVVGVPRDSRGVTGILPLSDKTRFAWDPPPGVRPGSPRGNVLLNAHTWPDGTGAGNVLLDELDVGDRILLRGDGQAQCYEVRRRSEVTADTRVPDYYDTDGPPQVAIVVCSGERTGPGEWTHRTLWFARAVGSGGR